MIANQIRGLLAEQGIVLAKRIGTIRRELPGLLPRLEPHLRRALELQWQQLQALDRQIAVLDHELKELASESATCQRLMRERGVGPVIATAIAAEVPEPRVFRNGRHFAAFLGLVPGQDSTGGRAKLLGVTKRGDAYLRTQLVHGARSALRRAAYHDDERSRWAQAVAQRRGFNRAVVALANKLARRLWAILRYGEAFRATAAA
jgi:transposase